MTLVGIGGVVDTRKVDRRFRTGYKNNEEDGRNFKRAQRILIFGIMIWFIGLAANSATKSDTGPSSESPIELDDLAIQGDTSGASSIAAASPAREPALTIYAAAPGETVLAPSQPTNIDVVREVPPPIQKDESASIKIVQPPPRPYEKIYTDSEITQLEDDNQYHGDDPLVRRRLRLPEKQTGKLIA